MKFCKKCGERLESDDRFCSACGAKVTGSEIVTGASAMSEDEKAAFRQSVRPQPQVAPVPPQATNDKVNVSGTQQHFEEQFKSGYYTLPKDSQPQYETKKKKGGPKLILILAVIAVGITMLVMAVGTILRMKDDDDIETPPQTQAVTEAKGEDDTDTEAQSMQETEKADDHSIFVNMDAAREVFEPGLSEIGYVIDDRHTSIDDENAYYFMWDDDDSAFVLSFSNKGARFNDIQLYSCSWDMEMRMLELCEKKLDISFDRNAINEMKAKAEAEAADAEDHYGFSDYVYADGYMVSLMVSPYTEDESITEYSLFVEERYAETASIAD